MTRKIFRNISLVGGLVVFLCACLFFMLQYRQILKETYQALQQEAVYAENGLMLSGQAYLETLGEINRITWIDAQGEVIYDNRFPAPIANQLHCAEVSAALERGEGQGIRRSESDGRETMYYALLCDDGTVLRLSRPLSAVRYALRAVSPVLLVFVLVFLLSGALALRAARQIVKPINELDLDHPGDGPYPELSPLVGRIRDQNRTIHEQIEELNRRQVELSALTDSMSEGFLLIDSRGIILGGNISGLRQSGCAMGDVLPEKLSGPVRDAALAALAGKRAETLQEQDGQSWEWIANPVSGPGQTSGAVILMVDVTEREQREKLRQEFSANVSHELKTPLTSISGFAELMAQSAVPADKVREFSGDIYRESQRMIALVDDIIRLSRLDEGVQLPWEQVDLYDLAADTLDGLRPVADREGVALELAGEPVELRSVWPVLSEMVYNLCDNAIKYNRPGGSVRVTVAQDETARYLTVEDTGIGIPYADRKRVFERFYRVDKSHSKEIGGTGLGLSIVKHGAQFLGAQIELESEQGIGTTVRLIFPRPAEK